MHCFALSVSGYLSQESSGPIPEQDIRMSRKEPSKLSESFIVGVIAIVFLMIGYQTALFIHNAAVMEIAANRDEPDTVYVYASPADWRTLPESDGSRNGDWSGTAERRNSNHSVRAENVRRNLPRPKVESFPFDPNTASIDDFCRLGFTPKQAQSIDNYRSKGGRFRRREDFARSFVVSDSIYRRLEKYIKIPKIDLNLADSAAFDSLPGIGGWFAKKMIEHRTALRGYSYKEQLMDIYRFDNEKFEALKDLVEVNPSAIVPYPLWTLPADSLRKHPYIGNYETARAIILYRDNNPREKWTVEALEQAGILLPENAKKMSGCAVAEPD